MMDVNSRLQGVNEVPYSRVKNTVKNSTDFKLGKKSGFINGQSKKGKFTKEMYYVLLECFDNDLDSPENDVYLTDGIASAAKCQDLCKNYGDCNYSTHGSTAHPGKCWLKSKKATSLISHPGIIFGPKICGTTIT